MDLEILKDRLQYKIEFDADFSFCIKKQSVPLAKRWELFEFAVEKKLFVNINSYAHSKILESNPNFSWYDDFNIERRETNTFVNIIDMLEDKLADALDPAYTWTTLDKCLCKTVEEINALKEEFLASGYSGFTYDW